MKQVNMLAAATGLRALPAVIGSPIKGFVDPVSFPFSISAGALAVGALSDITASEKTPYGIDVNFGLYKSREQTQCYVGYVYGVGIILDPATTADASKIIESYEVVVKTGAMNRVVPFSECLRIAPGRFATTTSVDVATGCPSAPGKPQYPFPGNPAAWVGGSDSKIGIRCNYAGGTTVATVTGQVVVWGVLAVGDAPDVEAGTTEDMPCKVPTEGFTTTNFNSLMMKLRSLMINR